jgi:hypothetical protein
VQAELRRLDSPDAPEGIESFAPDDPECFILGVTAHVGPLHGEGEDLFHFTVCTPRWLLEHPPEKGFLFPRGYLVVERWDSSVVRRAIGDICRRAESTTWDEVAAKVARYGDWEFEDYTER